MKTLSLIITTVFFLTANINSNAQTVPYSAFDGVNYNLYPWYGKYVVLLTQNNSYDSATIMQIVANIDTGYAIYKDITGHEPNFYTPTYINGRSTIAEVNTTCGFGCGYIGFTGIELLSPGAVDQLYNAWNDSMHQFWVTYYELGRNFWKFSNWLNVSNANDLNTSFTTGFAVACPAFIYDRAGLNGTLASIDPYPDWNAFKTYLANGLSSYVADPTRNFGNAIENLQSPFGGPDLFAAKFIWLYNRFGDVSFLRDFYDHLKQLPSSNSAEDVQDNFIVAASLAANANLKSLFTDIWKWEISEQADDYLCLNLAQYYDPVADTIGLQNCTTVSPPCGNATAIDLSLDSVDYSSLADGGLKVMITNLSLVDVQSVRVYYEYAGYVGSEKVNGLLGPGITSPFLSIGSGVLDKQNDKLTVWISQPNDTVDCNPGNDTIHVELNYALCLDGVDDYVSLQDSMLHGTHSITIEAWLYWRGGGIWQRVFDFGDDTYKFMQLSPNGSDYVNGNPQYHLKPAFEMRIPDGNGGIIQEFAHSSLAMPVNSWTHLAATVDGDSGAIKLFINGIKVAENFNISWPLSEYWTNTNHWIGKSMHPWDPNFNGYIDELRIWNKARTQPEISSTMFSNAGVSKENGLIHYFNFEEGCGVTAFNAVNSNHGTLQSGAKRYISRQNAFVGNNAIEVYTEAISDRSVTLFWRSLPGVSQYKITGKQIGLSGEVSFSVPHIHDTEFQYYHVEGLSPSTSYEWSVAAILCGQVQRRLSDKTNFTTKNSCPLPPPVILVEVDSSSNPWTVKICWDTTSADHYKIRYRQISPLTTNWSSFYGNNSNLNCYLDSCFSGPVTPGFSYQFAIYSSCISCNINLAFNCQTGFENCQEKWYKQLNKIQGNTIVTVHVPNPSNSMKSLVQKERTISLYPNPASEYLNISRLHNDLLYPYTIYDMAGQLVLQGSVSRQNPEISLKELDSGVYIFHLLHGETVVKKKITVIKSY